MHAFRSKSSLGAMLALIAGGMFAADGTASVSSGSASIVNRGATPALGKAVNGQYSGGGAALGQKKRRKLARQTTRPNRGVRCQGRRPGSGRRSR